MPNQGWFSPWDASPPAVRVLVIEHPGDRPTAITIQVSGSDAASRSRIDSTLSGVRVP